MTRVKIKEAGAKRPVKQNYNKSGKLEARRELRRTQADARNAASTPEKQAANRVAYKLAHCGEESL